MHWNATAQFDCWHAAKTVTSIRFGFEILARTFLPVEHFLSKLILDNLFEVILGHLPVLNGFPGWHDCVWGEREFSFSPFARWVEFLPGTLMIVQHFSGEAWVHRLGSLILRRLLLWHQDEWFWLLFHTWCRLHVLDDEILFSWRLLLVKGTES